MEASRTVMERLIADRVDPGRRATRTCPGRRERDWIVSGIGGR